MKFNRKLSKAGTASEDMIQWKVLEIKLQPTDATPIKAEVPAEWSDTAAQIVVTKYFRKAGVPTETLRFKEEEIPQFLWRSKPSSTGAGSETSVKQVLHRLAGAWTYHGWKMGLFKTLFGSADEEKMRSGYINDEKSAHIFYDELYLILAKQLAAPNSPQWFNTGLWWAYGIEGSASGQWAVNYDPQKAPIGQPFETKNAYEYPQPHACFIQPVADDLVNPGGIMDLWTREVRLFKQGSGTGSNFSNIRGEGEPLSGGGRSSGLMSFLEIGDRAAGAIKSGGVTRRAAKMVVVDADHPEVENFTEWKMREEQKAAAMWAGSRMMTDPVHREYMLKWGLMPQAMIDRMDAKIPFEEFGIDYEGEAIRTVGGQNANNTVRVTDDFMNLIEKGEEVTGTEVWKLTERMTGEATKYLPAASLWTKILRAAWASADPGLQFHDTINKWHTCKADGEIKASNPCSEYMFLDDTACNLASINLGKFYTQTDLRDPRNYNFDVDLFCHVARLMTIVLDISVTMASFPSREVALGSYNYRTLGLGYANLGGLLMAMGLPYDSDEGRDVAASITALMTGVAYNTSAELAKELGSFPRFKANDHDMNDVIDTHHQASWKLKNTTPLAYNAISVWDKLDGPVGYRNAQTTLLAPTGTIGLAMDCDTLGIEPDFSLLKEKSLAGGGKITIVNQTVQIALAKLGYNGTQQNLILGYIKSHGTVEGCVDLKPEHVPIFDCAVPPKGFSRCIEPMGHVKMMAAVQPFLSGAISKTINMPNSATVEDVGEVYMAAWKLGLKAVAIYRDGSKLAQPLQASGGTEDKKSSEQITLKDFPTKGNETTFMGRLVPRKEMEAAEVTMVDADFGAYGKNYEEMHENPIISKGELKRGEREYLPWRREKVITQKVNISGQSVHLTIGCYPDGRPGEIRIDLSRVGTTLNAFADMVAMMVSLGLQYGVPVEEYVKRLSDRKFEPSGFIEGHENIKWSSSIADYISRELGITFLGRKDMGQVESSVGDSFKEKGELIEIPKPYKPLVEDWKPVRDICPECHEPALVQSGTCKTCTNCGYNDGCGG